MQKDWCHVIKYQLSSLSYYARWAKITLYRSIQDLRWWVPCAYPILDPMILSMFKRWERRSQNLYPTFKLGSSVRRAYKLLIEYFLKKRSRFASDCNWFQVQPNTCCDLSIFLYAFIVYSIDSSKHIHIFSESSIGYFSNSTSSFVTSSRFSLFIGW